MSAMRKPVLARGGQTLVTTALRSGSGVSSSCTIVTALFLEASDNGVEDRITHTHML